MAVIKKKKEKYKCGEGYEKGNSPILLVGAATVENSMEVFQKTKNKAAIQPNSSTPGHIPESKITH